MTGGARPAATLDAALAGSGFNAVGALAASEYDALVPAGWQTAACLPEAHSALVLGCGGRAFGEAFAGSPEADLTTDPIDRFTRRVVERAARALQAWGSAARALYYHEERRGRIADFVALGLACGLGAPSRLGLLLHPVFGPWISIRAVLLTSAPFSPTPPLAHFEPCTGCVAPCAVACPGAAVAGARFDVAACAGTTRVVPTCRIRCDARRACVVGPEHAYGEDLERRFRASAVAILDPSRSNPSQS